MKPGKRKRPDPPKPAAPPVVPSGPSASFVPAACILLSLLTLAVYWQTSGHGFVAYDDDQYVYQNSQVKAGLSLAGMAWASTTFFYANWHPLTWISYMLDFSLFGSNPGAQHLINVALHIGTTLLLFFALLRMTRQAFRCALVAGIFALHPLHVESVAWISERKDVLSAFFEVLALLLYARYAEQRTVLRYATMALAFALSLGSKPMAVTFPFLLLLVDFWPLRRIEWPPAWPAVARLVPEKLPLLAMSAAASFLTFEAQKNYGAVASLTNLPVSARIANALVAYLQYIGKSLWPADLAVLYPPQSPSFGDALGAAFIIAAITVAAILLARRRPYLLTGWFWYLGMMVPVIGLVQVGVQSMADRYSYLPMVGLSIAIVWLIADLTAAVPSAQQATGVAALAALLLLAAVAYHQTGYWKTSRSLFEHTLAVTKRNRIIENNLGVILADEGNLEQAIALHRDALAIDPDYVDAMTNLGHELLKSGKLDEAFPRISEAVRLNPQSAIAQGDLGTLWAARGNMDEARQHLEVSLRIVPADASHQSNLCYVLQRAQRLDDAMAHCNEALRLQPDFEDARFNLGTALAAKGQRDAAKAALTRVLAANPKHPGAQAALDQLR
jgi:tetratricopeptide (TPR) repeat protein